jgi:hypothetical protein
MNPAVVVQRGCTAMCSALRRPYALDCARLAATATMAPVHAPTARLVDSAAPLALARRCAVDRVLPSTIPLCVARHARRRLVLRVRSVRMQTIQTQRRLYVQAPLHVDLCLAAIAAALHRRCSVHLASSRTRPMQRHAPHVPRVATELVLVCPPRRAPVTAVPVQDCFALKAALYQRASRVILERTAPVVLAWLRARRVVAACAVQLLACQMRRARETAVQGGTATREVKAARRVLRVYMETPVALRLRRAVAPLSALQRRAPTAPLLQ